LRRLGGSVAATPRHLLTPKARRYRRLASLFWRARVLQIGDGAGGAPGNEIRARGGDDQTVARKLVLTVLALGATLALAPTVLGAVRGPGLQDTPFTTASPASHGSLSGPAFSGRPLLVGVPVRSTLTIANDAERAARYRLSARVAGDRPYASRLRLVVSRRSDHGLVYAGPVTRLQAADLGSFGARATQVFDLRVTLLSTGSTAGDNVLQGRTASVDFGWTSA
jgi:hypothetical protein